MNEALERAQEQTPPPPTLNRDEVRTSQPTNQPLFSFPRSQTSHKFSHKKMKKNPP